MDTMVALLALLEQEQCLFPTGHQVASPPRRLWQPHLLEKLAGDQLQAIRLPKDHPQKPLLALVLQLLVEDLDRAADGRQGVPNLMGNAGRSAPPLPTDPRGGAVLPSACAR